MEYNTYENVDRIEKTQPRRSNTLKITKDILNSVYAGFWVRLVAFLIDIFVIGALQNILKSPFIAFGSIPTGLFLTLLDLAVYLAYFVLMTKFTNGQTLGKMIMNIRVISFKEDILSWETVLIRELCGRYIQKVILLLYLITAFTSKKQHFADYLADTSVIKENLYELYDLKKR